MANETTATAAVPAAPLPAQATSSAVPDGEMARPNGSVTAGDSVYGRERASRRSAQDRDGVGVRVGDVHAVGGRVHRELGGLQPTGAPGLVLAGHPVTEAASQVAPENSATSSRGSGSCSRSDSWLTLTAIPAGVGRRRSRLRTDDRQAGLGDDGDLLEARSRHVDRLRRGIDSHPLGDESRTGG